MARRGQNSGGIYQRADGRWVAVITLPAQDGTRTRRYFYGHTRRAVQQQLTAALRDQQQGLPVAADCQTVEQFLDTWLTRVCRPAVHPSTEERYTQLIRRHILPSLGHQPLTTLTPSQLTALYGRLLENGVSPRIVQHVQAIFHRAMEQAVRWGLIARNPATAVEPPRPQPREAPVLGLDQLGRFLEVARADRLYVLYALAIMTGMRQGELLRLHWSDIDWSTRQVSVRRQMARSPGGLVAGVPNTPWDRRIAVLPELALEALRQHRRAQRVEREAAGHAWYDHDLVFPDGQGRPIERQNLHQYSFRPLLQRAGLPAIRFHDLWHSTATLLLAQGVPPTVVQAHLGHAIVATLTDTDNPVVPGMEREAVDKLDQLFQADDDTG